LQARVAGVAGGYMGGKFFGEKGEATGEKIYEATLGR